eukprot:4127805-Prymnesium_polylepis.1
MPYLGQRSISPQSGQPHILTARRQRTGTRTDRKGGALTFADTWHIPPHAIYCTHVVTGQRPKRMSQFIANCYRGRRPLSNIWHNHGDGPSLSMPLAPSTSPAPRCGLCNPLAD